MAWEWILATEVTSAYLPVTSADPTGVVATLADLMGVAVTSADLMGVAVTSAAEPIRAASKATEADHESLIDAVAEGGASRTSDGAQGSGASTGLRPQVRRGASRDDATSGGREP